MTENEIIIYGFIMGNSDPQFQHFVRSLSNQDVHNLRKILYQQMYNLEQNGVSAARHGRDRYGFIIVPKIRQQQLWQQSGDRLFSYIKDLWVASVLGYNDPGMNPVKQIQWKSTRARAVTSRREGWQIICSTAIEVGLAYVGARIVVKPVAIQTGQYLSTVRGVYINKLRYDGKVTGFSISRYKGYGAKPRIDYHRLGKSKKKTRSISPGENKKLLHYHRGSGNGLQRHRPWEVDGKIDNFWNRFFDRF